jgi:hypothetical protein
VCLADTQNDDRVSVTGIMFHHGVSVHSLNTPEPWYIHKKIDIDVVFYTDHQRGAKGEVRHRYAVHVFYRSEIQMMVCIVHSRRRESVDLCLRIIRYLQ